MGGGVKLRWHVEETDHGEFRPAWPKTMSYGKPWQQFRRSQPKLQYYDGERWQDVPTVVIGRKSPEEKAEDAHKQCERMREINRAVKKIMKRKP